MRSRTKRVSFSASVNVFFTGFRLTRGLDFCANPAKEKPIKQTTAAIIRFIFIAFVIYSDLISIVCGCKSTPFAVSLITEGAFPACTTTIHLPKKAWRELA